ncbi:hypothetical protein [Arthrobacter roseus]|uniref:hypothetical protein n=1 Tax=Arthrobacter roseus TaxID=136274 RepID=UPI001965EB1E|nr:hypothetical protein [Arthrobacter roseus]MBM7849330.1 hypothetical protein [Arthrobacter roseus]
MIVFVLVIGLAVGVACGWRFKSLSGKSTGAPADTRVLPPAAVIFEEGYAAGWNAAAISSASAVPENMTTGTTTASAAVSTESLTPRPVVSTERTPEFVRVPENEGARESSYTSQQGVKAPKAVAATSVRPKSPGASKVATADARASRDLRNINITLFTASLLLVAATTLFIGSDFSSALRFGVVVSVTSLFYGGGLWIHKRVIRLRPAGVAFVGAALAMIPFVGLALNIFVLHHLGWSWIATAVLGGAAFLNAAIRLKSRVVAYLTLPFMLSVAWAPANVLGAGLVWYFAATIAAAAVLTVIGKLRPRWAGRLYLQVIQEVHGYIVPGVIGVSLLNFSFLEALDYFFISAAAFFYYVASLWVVARSRAQVLNVYGLRVTLVIAVLSVAATLEADAAIVVNVGAACVALQSIAVVCLPSRWAVCFDTHLAAMRTSPLPGSGARDMAPVDSPRGVDGLRAWQIVDVYWTFGIALLMAFIGLAIGSEHDLVATEILTVVLTAALVAMLLAWRIRKAGEFLVPAALVLVLFMPPYELWRFEIIVAVVLTYAVLRAVTSLPHSVTQTTYVLVARAQAVVAVGLLVADYWPSVRAAAAPHLGILAIIVALVINQFVSLVQLLRKRDLRSPAYVIVVSGGVAYVAAVLLLANFAPEWLVTAGLWLPLFGLAVPATLLFHRLAWLEAVSPIAIVTTAVFAIPVFGVHDYELLLTGSVGYAFILAAHHPDRVARSVYRYTAQGLVAVAASVFTYGHWSEAWGIGALSMALVVLSLGFLINQLVSLGQLRRGASAKGVGVATTVYAVLSIGTVSGLLQVDGPLWTDITALWTLSLGTVISGLALFRRLRWIEIPSGAVFPLTAFLAMSVFEVVDYEILLGIGLVYCFTIAALHDSRFAKGSYFLSGQIQLTLLTSVFLWDQRVSIHTFVTVFTISLLVQELLRTLFRRYTRNLDFQRASGWLTIAFLAATQAGYLVLAGALAQRGVTATALAVLCVVALVISAWSRKELRYLALACVPLMLIVFSSAPPFSDEGWLGAAELPDAAVATLSTILAVLVMTIRSTTAAGRRRMTTATVATVVFLVEGLVFSVAASGWAPAGVLLIVAIVVLLESHTWNVSWLYGLGSIVSIAACWCAGAEIIRMLNLEWGFRELQLLAHSGAFVFVYAWIMVGRRYRVGKVRRLYAILPVVTALALGSLAAMTGGQLVVAASVLLVVAAFFAAREVPKRRRELAGEGIFLVAVFAAAGIWNHLDPTASIFWFVQTWAVAIALIALYEHRRGRPVAGQAWMLGAAAILSTSGLLALLTQDSGYQLWALLGHVALLLHGVIRQSRTFTWWGAAGLSLAVLWFLRGYTFILLTLVAAVLIAFAVWRLNRSKDSIES